MSISRGDDFTPVTGNKIDKDSAKFLESLSSKDHEGPPIPDKIAKIVNEKFYAELSLARR